LGLEFKEYLHGRGSAEDWKRHFVSAEEKLDVLEEQEVQHADEVEGIRAKLRAMREEFEKIEANYAKYRHDDKPVDRIVEPAIEATIEASYDLSVLQSRDTKREQSHLLHVITLTILITFGLKTAIVVALSHSIHSDVRKLQEMERKLVKSNEELSRFVYFVSHDLREPARMVGCYMKLLREKCECDTEQEELVGFAIEGSARLEALLDSLLTYSRLDAEAVRQEVELCSEVIQVALRDLRLKIEESGAEVVFSCDNPDPDRCRHCRVVCDPLAMIQVFENLIENAVKYRKKDVPPKITIHAQRNEQGWLFCVEDNGIGIAASDVSDNLFKVFKRLHTRDQYPGCGIGLASCKRIIERHGGEIWVASEQGVGTRFYFTLPN